MATLYIIPCKKSYYVDSVLVGRYNPGVFVWEDKRNYLHIIWGVQGIKAIEGFLRGDFALWAVEDFGELYTKRPRRSLSVLDGIKYGNYTVFMKCSQVCW